MIFKDNAMKYWNVGLPAIPLHKYTDVHPTKGTLLGKAPLPKAWQLYHDRMPEPIERAEWLRRYPDNNIGLVLGKQSRCVALDIDSYNDAEVEFILSLTPKSPFIRRGKKGMVLMYRFNGEESFQIKNTSGQMIVELLSTGKQVVLPPSIHPDTQEPYTSTANLYDVVDSLPLLPKDIETMLRRGLKERFGVELDISGWTRTVDYVSAGSRDVKMTSVAGIYALSVLRGERTLREAMEMMEAWCANFVEKVAGDNIDSEKAVKNLVKFLIRDVDGPKKRVLPSGWDDGLTLDEKRKLGVDFGEEALSWDFKKLNNYLCEKLPQTALKPEERNEVIDTAIEKIAKSNTLSTLEEDRCIKHIANVMPDITVQMLRKRISELRCDGIIGNSHTEIAMAALKDLNDMIPMYEVAEENDPYPSMRYYNGKFYRWGGSHWESIELSEIEKFVATEYGNLKEGRRNSDHKGIVNIMRNLLGHELVSGNISGVNFANGFVDIYGQIHKHSRKFGCTYTLPYCYEPQKEDLEKIAPKFWKFLKSVWGEEADFKERINCLRQVIGSTMFGFGPSFNRAVLLYGVGGSGKSQLMTIVRKLLPKEVVSVVSPYDFADKFKVTMLCDARLNVCGELKNKGKIPADIFKQITDGEMLQGQYKNGQIFYFSPKATHWFASNYLPNSTDGSEGFNRRWVFLSFNRIVPTSEKVRDLGDIIVAEERAAIAAWAIGCVASLNGKSDFDLPPSHYDLVDKMHAENDSLFFYLTSDKEGCPRRKCGSSVPIRKLYENYQSFCYTMGVAQRVTGQQFVNKLNELGVICGFSINSSEVESITLAAGDGEVIRRIKR